MEIWVDSDACPRDIRDIIFRAGERCGVKIKMVANSVFRIPSPHVELVVVSGGFDAADDHIADQVAPGDLVITSDIPLADRVIEKGALALSHRGEVFDRQTIKEKLRMRNLYQELRSAGEIHGGPAPQSGRDRQRFADTFDRLLTRAMKGSR